jgi:uncharacterized membrane protein YeaQ/YmgE (transglycosylase-associated protein family)
MSLLVTIVLGGILGWLASRLINGSSDLGALANVAAGSVGALTANICVDTLLGVTQAMSVGLVIGAIGAVAGVALLRMLSIPAPKTRRARK